MNNFIFGNQNLTTMSVGLILIIIWGIFWKGLALWHSARRKQPWWFIIILVLNTTGILEIIYLLFVAKLKISELFPTNLKSSKSSNNPDGPKKIIDESQKQS
jgi:hypothetical protein